MKAWKVKEDKKSNVNEKGKETINNVKSSTSSSKRKYHGNLIEYFNKLPPLLDNFIIGKRSKSMTPPLLLTFQIFNMNVYNCLVGSSASSNVIPYVVCKKINEKPQKTNTQIIHLD
jgi:hypothetical protein